MQLNHRQLKKILDHHFDFIPERSNSEELTIVCPEPGCGDQSGNRSFSVKKGLTNCWRCNKAYSTSFFLKQHGVELEDGEMQVNLAGAGDRPIDSVLQDLALESKVKNESKSFEVPLPDGFRPITQIQNQYYYRQIKEMAQRKHLELEDFISAGVGCTEGGFWEDYAIFPILEQKRVVNYQGRTFELSKEGGRTKMFPSKSVVPIPAGNWVYGYDEAWQAEIIIVVESILNVLSLRKVLQQHGVTTVAPVAVFKHAITKTQREKIEILPAQEICIMYDGDATTSAHKECGLFIKPTTVAEMPVGIDANDDRDLALERFLTRQKSSPIQSALGSILI